jgi:RNA polymerase sigma-70 factor (ECF subfamily)
VSDVDAAFARFCSGGRPQDLAIVFVALAEPLRREAVRMLRDRTVADDLVQSTFVAAIELRERYDPSRGDAHGWLRGLLRNRGLHALRAGRRAAAEELGVEPVDACFAERAALRELARETVEEMGRLPEPYRSVLQSVVLAGESPEHVARLTGRPAATVRSQLKRGLTRLRRALPTVLTALARALSGVCRPHAAAIALVAVTVGVLIVALVLGSTGSNGPVALEPRPEVLSSGASAQPSIAGGTAQDDLGTDSAAPLGRTRVETRRERAITVVRDEDGSVVAGIALTIVDAHGHTVMRPADAAGRLSIAGLRDDDVIAIDWARVRVPLERLRSESSPRLRIPPGFSLVGRVVDVDGRPVADARILWRGAEVEVQLARAAADGSYLCRDLSPSLLHRIVAVGAEEPSTGPGTNGGIVVQESTGAVVQRDLRVEPQGTGVAGADSDVRTSPERRDESASASVAIELEIGDAFDVHGWTAVLLAANDDQPLWTGPVSGASVVVEELPAAAGRIVLLAPADGLQDVTTRPLATRPSSRFAMLELRGGRRIARFEAGWLPSAWLDVTTTQPVKRVVILDPSGRPAGIFENPDGHREIAVGPLPPGRVVVALACESGLWMHHGPFELARGIRQRCTLRVESGQAELDLALPSSFNPADLHFTLCAAGVPVLVPFRARPSDPIVLAPGHYRLFWSARGQDCASTPLDLAVGPQRLTLQPLPAREPRTLEFRFADGARPADERASIDLRVLAGDGRLTWRERVVAPLDDGGGLTRLRALPVGSTRVIAVDRRGARATTEIDGDASTPVRLILRVDG